MPCASRCRGEAAHRHADTLRFVLFEARPEGLLFPQLIRASELSPSQVRAGLAWLRDIIAEKEWSPLIWTRADGYQLGAERAVLAGKIIDSAGSSPERSPRTLPPTQTTSGSGTSSPSSTPSYPLDLIAS